MRKGISPFWVLIAFLPPLFIITVVLSWVGADSLNKNTRNATDSIKAELTQQLASLPVYPGAIITEGNSFDSDFVPFRNMYTAVATIFYKANSNVTGNDVLAFYNQELSKLGWNSSQGYFVSKGRYLQVSSYCASDVVKDTIREPERSCTQLKGGYQKIQLLMACDVSRAKECR